MSAARPVYAYGLPEVAVASQRAGQPSSVLPLLIIVCGLAAATIWFVALPVLPQARERRTGVRGVRHAIGHHQVRPLREARILGGAPEVPPPRQSLTGRSHAFREDANKKAGGHRTRASFRSCVMRRGRPPQRQPASPLLAGSPGRGVFRDVRGVREVSLPAAVGVHDEDVGGAVGGIVALTDEGDLPSVRRPFGTVGRGR